MVCGGTSFVYSQGLENWKPELGPESRFPSFDWPVPKYPHLNTPEVLEHESMNIVVPRSLRFEKVEPIRPITPQFVSAMPIYSLPDPQVGCPLGRLTSLSITPYLKRITNRFLLQPATSISAQILSMKIRFLLALFCLFLPMCLIAQEKLVYELNSKELFQRPQPSPEFSAWLKKNNEKLGQKAPLSSKSGTRVTLVFIVTEEGKIKDLGVWRGIGQGYDEYAYHLVKKQPSHMATR
jgi:hypothetical protein